MIKWHLLGLRIRIKARRWATWFLFEYRGYGLDDKIVANELDRAVLGVLLWTTQPWYLRGNAHVGRYIAAYTRWT